MAKIDPELTMRLLEPPDRASAQSIGLSGDEPTSPVHVFVTYTGSVETLKSHGLKVFSDVGGIATGDIDIGRIEELAELDSVIYIKSASQVQPLLDTSVPQIHADVVRKGSPPFRGDKVIVGIVDTGIDIFHHGFRNADRTTRILWIWDQTLEPKPGEKPPDEFNSMGVEYDADHINNVLNRGGKPFHHRDNEGHGTHVAGIAAGDGSDPGYCHKDQTYIGVAPAADLIIVKVFPDPDSKNKETSYAWGVDYIFQKAQKVNKAAVVNLSLGTHLGAHDGTDSEDIFLDALLTVPRRVIVASAGNEGGVGYAQDIADVKTRDGIHTSQQIAANSPLPLGFFVPPFNPLLHDPKRGILFDLWYSNPGRLQVSLADPSGAMLPPVAAGAPGVRNTLGGNVVVIVSDVDDPFNDKNRIRVKITSLTNGAISTGLWTFNLQETAGQATSLHCWINRDREYGVVWQFPNRIPAGTIGIPATARRVIAVGAYDAHTPLKHADKSSRGPTPDSPSSGPIADERRKPDICAPGVNVISSLSREKDIPCCCDCCLNLYESNSGTSQAAPHVTGVVALMLEKNPDLTFKQVRDHIRASADPPGGGVTLPDWTWGHGLLNAEKAVQRVPPATRLGPEAGSASGSEAGASSDPEGVGGPQGSIVPPAASDSAGPFPFPSLLGPLVWRMSRSSLGQVFAALVSSHFDEVLRLVNNNRRVATMWHRMSGPSILREILRDNNDHRVLIPEKVGEQLISESLARFLAILSRYGSAALRRDITEHRRILLALPGASVADIETWNL